MVFCTTLKLRKIVSAFSFCMFFLLLCELLHLQQNVCSELDSLHQIHELCSQYHNKEVVGSMCSELCDQSVFTVSRCHGNKLGKKVIIMECDGCIEPRKTSKVVLKSEYDMHRWPAYLIFNPGTASTLRAKLSLAEEDIRLHALDYYDTNLSDHDDIISWILGENFQEKIQQLGTPNATDTVLRTAMVLGSQEEFLSFRILGEKPFMPKIYGTCGPAYFVEYTPSFSSLNYIFFVAKKPDIMSMSVQSVHSASWSQRAKAALSLLKSIKDMEDSYNTPLHHCDIKPHNFGLSDSGEVVMLDTDCLKFGQVVLSRSCDADIQCSFMSCLGKCNITTKWCEKEMFTNNLQEWVKSVLLRCRYFELDHVVLREVQLTTWWCEKEIVASNVQIICKRIFIGAIHAFGLLRSAPASIQKRLTETLHRCANPVEKIYKPARETKSDRRVLNELVSLLKSTL